MHALIDLIRDLIRALRIRPDQLSVPLTEQRHPQTPAASGRTVQLERVAQLAWAVVAEDRGPFASTVERQALRQALADLDGGRATRVGSVEGADTEAPSGALVQLDPTAADTEVARLMAIERRARSLVTINEPLTSRVARTILGEHAE